MKTKTGYAGSAQTQIHNDIPCSVKQQHQRIFKLVTVTKTITKVHFTGIQSDKLITKQQFDKILLEQSSHHNYASFTAAESGG